MKKIVLFTTLTLDLLFLNSCTTYYISVNSFKEQFKDGLITAKTKTINCIDKTGNPISLTNTHNLEIRFTYGEKNKRTVFYFDSMFVNDSTVTGSESIFIKSLKKIILFDSITKIELQKGKRN